MAAPEIRNSPKLTDGLAAADPAASSDTTQQSDAGYDWFEDFKPVERVFLHISNVLLVGVLIAVVGYWREVNAVTIAGLVIISLAVVGIATLSYPLSAILFKMLSAWRRRRADERA